MAESLNPGKRKKNKKYHGGGKKGKLQKIIQVGMRGVLVFGADNEAKARREAYSLLNEYADELFGTEFMEERVTPPDGDKKRDQQHGEDQKIIDDEDEESSEEKKEDDLDDIEKVIAKEIKQIKNLKESRRFQDIATGVNAILFIKTTLSKDELNKLIQSVLSDIVKTKQNKARSFQRLVPITDICSADLNSIKKTVKEYILPSEDARDYTKKICVHFKSRFNSNLTRQEVLHEVSSIFLNAGYKVDLKSPDMTIVVEVMKGLCFMSILNDFFHFKKYNLHSVANEAKNNAKDTVEENSAEIGSSVYDDYYPCVGIQI